MQSGNFEITCTKCKGHDRLTITPQGQVFYKNHVPIISARYRPDLKWGFECMCGNDSRVAVEEKASLQVLVRGGEHAIDKIAKSLTRGNEKKFLMEAVR